jgi:hypothetical protein
MVGSIELDLGRGWSLVRSASTVSVVPGTGRTAEHAHAALRLRLSRGSAVSADEVAAGVPGRSPASARPRGRREDDTANAHSSLSVSHTKVYASLSERRHRAAMRRVCVVLPGAATSHSPSHLMTPLSKWSVGSVIGDGARSVSLCRSMSTFVTWTKPAALARSRSSHVLLSASTMASRE